MNNILNYDSYLSDYGPKNFRGAGTTFKFSKKNERETITARGPLTESLTLLVSNQYTINILEACNSTNLVVALLIQEKGHLKAFCLIMLRIMFHLRRAVCLPVYAGVAYGSWRLWKSLDWWNSTLIKGPFDWPYSRIRINRESRNHGIHCIENLETCLVKIAFKWSRNNDRKSLYKNFVYSYSKIQKWNASFFITCKWNDEVNWNH